MTPPYILTDVAGVHYWTGRGFVPAEGRPYRPGLLRLFATGQQARRMAHRCRKRGIHLRVLPPELAAFALRFTAEAIARG
jgi:hypothetical protein